MRCMSEDSGTAPPPTLSLTHPLPPWPRSVIMPRSDRLGMTGSVRLSSIWFRETQNVHGGQFLINMCMRVCMRLCEGKRQGDREICGKKIRDRSAADRQAGSPVYPQDDQATVPFPAAENQCRSSREIKFIWGCWCWVYSLKFPCHLLYRGNG